MALWGDNWVPRGGVFGEQPQTPQGDARLAFASQLLAGSGGGSNFAEIMGKALLASREARMQTQQIQQQKAAQLAAEEAEKAERDSVRSYREAQIAQMNKPEQVKPPQSVQEYEYAKQGGFAGSFQDWITQGSPTTALPSNVVEAQWYENATPEQRAIYDKQNGRDQAPYFQWVQRVLPDGSTQQGTFNARTGATQWDQNVVPAGTKPRVDAAGKVAGETQAAAQVDLPRIVDNAKQAKQAIDDLLASPGASRIYGVKGAFPNMPGSKASDAQAKLEQIQGKTFLEAFNSLKGGGQITEVEGKKATDAIAALQKAQSWEAAQKELKKLKEVIDEGVRRAEMKAGPSPLGPGVNGNAPWSPPQPGTVIDFGDLR